MILHRYRDRASFICLLGLAFLLVASAFAEPLTLPLHERPEWVRQDGIVMAGSWEPLLFRVRRDGSDGYTPTPEQRAAYEREHSAEMVQQLKDAGVNFVMMHCYKGAGLEAERESMADAVRFAGLCHEAGLKVGVYCYSGAFIWELFFKEHPEARDWVLLDEHGEMRRYGSAQYRCYWDRNHPAAQAFYQGIVAFAVQDIGTDLLHFDNYSYGPGSDPNSTRRFREYLRNTFSESELHEMGVTDLGAVNPALAGPPDNLLRRAWLDFHAQSLADSYREMGQFARSLRKDVLLECNPGGPGKQIGDRVDHGRLLPYGEAFWDEGRHPGYHDGVLETRVRTYKVARRMDNMAFAYCTTPLELAEAMAFNLDCLGCVCWFEYGEIERKPGSKETVASELAPFIAFFHQRRDLLRDADIVADVAVLRSYPSQVFANPKHAALTAKVEQQLIEHPTCFQIIYEHHLDDLARYRVLVLAGCVALPDDQIRHIRRYVEAGGRLCIIGDVATHDEWMRPRSPGLDGLPDASVMRIDESGDVMEAIRRASADGVTLSVQAPAGICAEVTDQSGRRLVHLVNYHAEGAANDIAISLEPPRHTHATAVELISPEHEQAVPLPFKQEGGMISFTVPTINVYGIAVVTVAKDDA
ncbi:MAG TPA: hypothetical protein PLO37_24210 [Candidatus Hydrogenedentes bacterium]|nr:hypothetical protein [Candidatus Hydrogenedentota bacterium]HPG69968.1 hypothetical protein [Candidatus Hydrogenedentota bacterium]